ncbi:hypothetical protein FGE12_18185 [Aggregicoccus sp. 17bor-14]|uniref:hypothetical protein n=1 Tax=Myxococcaceae TaxID=31 RepID=UPI00129CF931|nr:MULTISPECIES: hypothetical protein [Myxococcaceae]MBF5044333.1 hypothetical protein [Simulacricoccus sp. 17bor-14]MRI90080.1 hypothetical protein [Aggregicoccus sp. 17bor-14]
MILQALTVALALASSQSPRVDTHGAPPLEVHAGVPVFPNGNAATINIVQWDANALPPIYERSDQLPLTDEEVAKLSRAGFGVPQLVKMIEQRRCACDASADGLIRLKQQGVAPDVIHAVSTHALAPNRWLDLLVTLDFTGESRIAREGFLYFFLDDGDITRVYTANIPELLRRSNAHDTMIDRSDIMIAHTVRRIELPGRVPLRIYGKHQLLVAASANPTLTHPSQLTAAERAKSQLYTFDYPRSSITSLCRITAGYRRDEVLVYQWHFKGSRLECEWN